MPLRLLINLPDLPQFPLSPLSATFQTFRVNAYLCRDQENMKGYYTEQPLSTTFYTLIICIKSYTYSFPIQQC
jgi:hypothetical protein